MKFNKLWLAIGIVAIIIAGVFFANSRPTDDAIDRVGTVPESPLGADLSEEETVDVTMDVLRILNELYFVTQETTASVEPESISGLIVDMTTESIRDKTRLDGLLTQAQRLSTHDNEIVKTVGLGFLAGIQSLSKAEAEMIAYLRGVDETSIDLAEFQYQIASFAAAQKESFYMIALGAGQLPAIFWEFASSENPTGLIPYRISNTNRQKILLEIDRLFAEGMRKDEINHSLTGNRNAVLLVVQTYIDGLKYDTYEEAGA